MKRWYKCLFVLLTGILLVALYKIDSVDPHRVVINEVCSNNFSLLADEEGKYPDYVELYNTGLGEICLDGCYLSDDKNNLKKYPLDSICVPPEGYYIIRLDGSDDPAAGRTGFKLSRMGDEIFLSDGSGQVLDSAVIPELSYNTVYARTQDGGEEWGIMAATAGDSNNKAKLLLPTEASVPVFSVESGFYEGPFVLEISAGEGEEIYYTLDGSDPTPDALMYQMPLEIRDASGQENVYAARTDLSPTRDYVPAFQVDKATVVRAISYDREKNAVSEIVSKVYFVGYGQREEYRGLPVISLVMDPVGLFDPVTGIYANGEALKQYMADGGEADGVLLDSFTDADGDIRHLYMASNAFNDGKEWEREAVLSCFDEAHEYCFAQNVGVRIAGQSTRSRIQKSLRIYGREIYDDNVIFPYEFFPGISCSTFKLRNGGNNNESVMITDAFLEELAEERNISIQRATPCILFLNGEYWGIYNIRERYGEEYLANHFGVSGDNVWMIDSEAPKVGGEDAWEAYNEMLDLILECDLTYDDVFEMICGFIDVQSLIDYCCINLYVNNRDISFGTNTALWRVAEPEESEYGDGRWRWMLYDMDISLFHDETVPLTWMEDYPLLNEPVIESLMKNEQFRKRFCLTFMDIANTTYSCDRVREELPKWAEIYREQVTKNHRRFDDGDFTEEDFDAYIAEIDDFFKNRFSFAMASLKEEFGLSGNLETVTLWNALPEGGEILLNTARLDDERWTGQYFPDYPLQLTAVAREGYRFAGWRGDVTDGNEQIAVNIPAGGLAVEAVFEKVD